MSAFDRDYFEREATYGACGGYAAMEETVRRFYRLYLDLAAATVPQLADGRGKSAHDVGCAYGVGVRELQRRGYEAYGSDVSAHAIEEARLRDPARERYAVASVRDRNAFSRRFELITCVHVLEHVKDSPAMVAALASSLKAGGYIVLATPNPASISPYRRFQRDPTHINEHPPQYWRALLAGAGLDVLSCHTFHIVPLIHRWIGLRYVAAPKWLGYDTVIVARR